jgi:hypothetical protein
MKLYNWSVEWLAVTTLRSTRATSMRHFRSRQRETLKTTPQIVVSEIAGVSCLVIANNPNVDTLITALESHVLQKKRKSDVLALPITLNGQMPAPAVVFSRLGSCRWRLQTFLLFDLDSFFTAAANKSAIYLVNDRALMASGSQSFDFGYAQSNGRSFSPGLHSLEDELRRAGALVASWKRSDLAQLAGFLTEWRNHSAAVAPQQASDDSAAASSKYSLLRCWSSLYSCYFSTGAHHWFTRPWLGNPNANTLSRLSSQNVLQISASPSPLQMLSSLSEIDMHQADGVLAYEVSMRIGMIIRACDAMGIAEDSWGMFYLEDIESMAQSSEMASQLSPASFVSFGDLLVQLFPQLAAAFEGIRARSNRETVAIKCFSHQDAVSGAGPFRLCKDDRDWDASMHSIPPKAEASSYRNIGNAREPALTVLNRCVVSHINT